MFRALRERLLERARARWRTWVWRRIPPASEVVLSQKNVFIFPSRAGLVFLLLLLCIMIAGTNYENNLVLAMAFLLAGLFVVAILHTYANLAGLRLAGSSARAVFAGERAAFGLRLRDEAMRRHDGLELRWPGGGGCITAVGSGREDSQALYVEAPRRGVLRPGRILLQSHFPLGLIRAWSWIDLDLVCLVYPRPAPQGELPVERGRGDEGYPTTDPGAEDFSNLRDYRPGDPLRHVAWKTLAKGLPLQTREYVAFADRQLWLDWEQTAKLGDTESRLSLLCRWVLESSRMQAEFGLRLPGLELQPAAGEAQREQALAALALFGITNAERRGLRA